MMSNGLVNQLIIWLARTLNCSPLIAHCIMMCLLSFVYGALNPDGFQVLADPVFLAIWFAFSLVVVLVTWLTKGDFKKAWTQAKPWR
jgi:surface polysaccharide O-acyltransferase-like enzyme